MGDFEEQLLDKFAPGWRNPAAGPSAGAKQADLDAQEVKRLLAEREARRSAEISAEHAEKLLKRRPSSGDGHWRVM